MYKRGNKRVGIAARCIWTAIIVVAIVTLALGIHAMRQKPPPARGSQALPAEAAARAGVSPDPQRRTE